VNSFVVLTSSFLAFWKFGLGIRQSSGAEPTEFINTLRPNSVQVKKKKKRERERERVSEGNMSHNLLACLIV